MSSHPQYADGQQSVITWVAPSTSTEHVVAGIQQGWFFRKEVVSGTNSSSP